MHRNFVALAAILLLAVAGCARVEENAAQPQPQPQPLPPTAPVVAEEVTVSKLQGGKFLGLTGPRKQYAEPFFNVAGTNYYCLRSFVDTRSGDTVHQLYVQYSYEGGPYKWSGAQDQDKKDLRFIPLNHNEITCDLGCSYADEFAAAVPEPLLRQSQGGLSVTFTGDNGAAKTVAVDGGLIAKQLGAVDAVRDNMKTVASTTAPTSAPATSAR
jgi:hypothetical protein